MSNNRLNKERIRLLYAFNKSTAEDTKNDPKYKSRVEKAPMLIYNNGLGNTLAFIYANKTKPGWGSLYQHIEEWLKEHYALTMGKIPADDSPLMHALLDKEEFDESAYRATTREVLKLLEGLKRFALSEKDIANQKQSAAADQNQNPG